MPALPRASRETLGRGLLLSELQLSHLPHGSKQSRGSFGGFRGGNRACVQGMAAITWCPPFWKLLTCRKLGNWGSLEAAFILCEAIRGGTGLEVALPWGPGLSVEGVSLCPTTHSPWRGLHLLPMRAQAPRNDLVRLLFLPSIQRAAALRQASRPCPRGLPWSRVRLLGPGRASVVFLVCPVSRSTPRMG